MTWTHVVIYEDRFGRALHGLTTDPQHTIARLIADGHITKVSKAAAHKLAPPERAPLAPSSAEEPPP